ncbi:MAG: low-specificity L-threonine aldolase [Dehalococcoidia bacterium]|nr:low-specificity L-threonine aldolase [Dehalococcoidia bacterium]
MSRALDFRSDTVTRPSAAMRQAMASAEVGDDVFGDDPTINRLEAMAAERVGKEAAVFVPSGTMANLLGVMTSTRPGDEVLLGDECHIFQYEVGGPARLAMVQTRTLHNQPDGSFIADDVRQAIRQPNIHHPPTSLLCLENTHNRCGGAVLQPETIDELAGIARDNRLRVHLDGARLFNAAVALGIGADRLARECDSVSFCFSKGLGCPVGSVLCGSREFIVQARKNRKMLGGGMRQAGILGAAAIYALENNVSRLAEDHANARALADGLRSIEGLAPNEPATNIVVVDVAGRSLSRWLAALDEAGVQAAPFGASRFRMVTHLDVTAADVEEAINRIERAAGALLA